MNTRRDNDDDHQFSFDFVAPSQDAREYHESKTQCGQVLSLLRRTPVTKTGWENRNPGGRIAPSIDILRNGYGFEIGGSGTAKEPYFLLDRRQWPTKVYTTKEIKLAYYETDHWAEIRSSRYEHDGYKCVACLGDNGQELVCHHIVYNLFEESLDEVVTVCKFHHQLIHDNSYLSFPRGVSLAIADRLVGYHEFEEWLKP